MLGPSTLCGRWSSDQSSQQIRSAARGMHLLACRLIGRAHHTRIFSANALPVTLFDGHVHAAGAGERKICLPEARLVLSPIAQIDIHFLRVDNFAGVENIVWIRGAL